MAQNVNRIVPVETLFQLIWGTESLEDTRTVAVHISNLRKKIETDPANPERIVTARGGPDICWSPEVRRRREHSAQSMGGEQSSIGADTIKLKALVLFAGLLFL
ncbi:winged helix-turn-helix domain-containing protein [Cohnella rhizosphaerae]|uniref:Helix-turn-helix domain-containing protein n=1 Tax=Cohnella rhizosphaerae TaxID=1457232 RepID=A0A9X4KSH7_9BACL|nr:helix-turn-helix domain-containing protein [Cohnella rhizosphaerae]MDG0810364.1 helix-turn-helix domain-containing protein [Cohnella rhizosphaerae]